MAVRVEDVKAAGIAVDIDALAATGFASISEEDRYRLKTQGVCTQRQIGAFMMRIRVPGGRASSRALRAVASLAERYGSPLVHLTTRGGFEIHHVRIENVPSVFTGLARVGLTTKGTCGDTIRNVIACAHAGVHAGEVLPLEPFARLLHERIVAISDATNISRKMNVALACSPACDDHVATSDIGFVATPSESSGALPTFTVWGAGGLGAAPHLAIVLRRGLAQGDLIPAFDALVALGVKHGDRTSRARAKIKMLVDTLGATRVRELFDDEFERARARGGYAALTFEGEASTATPAHDAYAALACAPAIAQKQPSKFTIPALVPMGELHATTARAIADAADRYGNGFVCVTPEQNVELHDVARADVAATIALVESAGLRTIGRGGITDVVSCVGLEYCPLAVTHSMTMGEEIAQAFASLATDPRYADFRIHVSGCPHSCAKHQVADIGLSGAQMTVDGARVEAFAFYIGGNARERRLGATYEKKIPRSAVLRAIRAVLARYERERLSSERFSATVARVGVDGYFESIARALSPEAALPTVRAGRLVVIGNGMAGARFVEELRDRASEAFDITVFGEEPHGGYNRIMLSSVLGGSREPGEIVTHPLAWYDDRRIELRSGARVVAVDRERRIVRTADGAETAYDALVFATGSRPVVPPVPGLSEAGNVFVFRTLADCDAIRAAASTATTAVVLGGGLLGLEAAAGLRALGVEPTVVHLPPSLMDVQLDANGGAALQRRIEALGIVVRADARAVRAYDDALGRGIELADGSRVAGDLIVLCCGTVPETRLAREAELACGRGIVVDDRLQTLDERVFALGECAEHRGVAYGLVEPLWEQCRVLADRLTGTAATYTGSQVGTRLKVAGVNVVAVGERDARPGDEVVSALDVDGGFRRAIARGGKLVGAQVVGDARAAAAFARAFERRTPLPGSLASFVFGVDALATMTSDGATIRERVCVCNDVSREEILSAIEGGAHDVAEIGRRTAAGTGCGTCRAELATLVIAATATAKAPADRKLS